jgi:ribosome-associated toxin RatA of RatAB toxin-antitoxin module
MGRIEGEASETIEAPIARVFEVAADVEGSPRWQPQIKRADCAERDGEGNQVLVDTVTDGKVRDLRSRLRFSYDEPTSIRWDQEEGDLSEVTGSWALEDLGDGTVRATYALSVDFGRMLGMVIRGPVVDLLRKQMVDTMPAKLKAFVENGDG